MYDSFGGYLKRSFRTIFQNNILFIPILLSFLTILIPTAIIFFGIKTYFISKPISFDPINLIFAIIIIVIFIIQLFISAGKINMIKKSIINDSTNMNDFIEGIKKYTGKIFLGILILIGLSLVFGIIAMPILILNGPKNGFFLLLMFLFIPMIVLYFLISFWQIILVYEDCGIIDSFKLSFSFVKKHFWLVFFVNILKGVVTGSKNNSNRNHRNSINFNFNRYFNFNMSASTFMRNFGTFSIIAVILAFINVFFNLYFDVMFFIIYHDRRNSIFDEASLDNLKHDSIDELDDFNI